MNEADQKSYLLESVHPDVVPSPSGEGSGSFLSWGDDGIGQRDSSGPILAEAPLGQVADNGNVGQ